MDVSAKSRHRTLGEVCDANDALCAQVAELQRENERLQAELSALRNSVRHKRVAELEARLADARRSVRATEQQLREVTAERDRLREALEESLLWLREAQARYGSKFGSEQDEEFQRYLPPVIDKAQAVLGPRPRRLPNDPS